LDGVLEFVQVAALALGCRPERGQPGVHHLELALDHVEQLARDAMLDNDFLLR
jgi:hypothetical protein